jgi:putative toxin-antitoxin system antitoxin component (TIGR02293 family)
MTYTWKISFGGGADQILEIGQKPYYFFRDSPEVVHEAVEAYSPSLDFKETAILFDFLDFTQADISELLEVDPSTLFRWKKEDRKLTKILTKNLLEMDQIIAKGIRIFGSEDLLAQWLQAPNPSLGHQKPAALLKNPYGLARVDEALEAISWGNIL